MGILKAKGDDKLVCTVDAGQPMDQVASAIDALCHHETRQG